MARVDGHETVEKSTECEDSEGLCGELCELGGCSGVLRQADEAGADGEAIAGRLGSVGSSGELVAGHDSRLTAKGTGEATT